MSDQYSGRVLLTIGDKLGRGQSRRGGGDDDVAASLGVQGREEMALELQALWCILRIYIEYRCGRYRRSRGGGVEYLLNEINLAQMLIQARADEFIVGERSPGTQSDSLQNGLYILEVRIELLFCTWRRIRDQYSHPLGQEKSRPGSSYDTRPTNTYSLDCGCHG